MLHKPETCELCYRTSEDNHKLLCEECTDKAAMYDILEHNHKMLLKTLDGVQAELNEAMQDETPENRTIELISSAVTQLRIAKQIYEVSK